MVALRVLLADALLADLAVYYLLNLSLLLTSVFACLSSYSSSLLPQGSRCRRSAGAAHLGVCCQTASSVRTLS